MTSSSIQRVAHGHGVRAAHGDFFRASDVTTASKLGTRLARTECVNRRAAFLSSSVVIALAAACGDASTSPFIAPGASNADDAGSSGVLVGSGSTPPEAPDAAGCATASADGALAPGNLIFMVDQSDSMWGTNRATRWDPATNALKAFFADASSNGFNASIQFFPLGIEDSAPFCAPATYAAPQVTLKPLPDATSFAGVVDAATNIHGTPTDVALQGAVNYAQATLAAHPDQKTVIVLVTDGLPVGCGETKDQALPKVINIAASSAATAPVYVIGVGPAVANLNDIATAGGTKAIFASNTSPAQTSADIKAALDAIRGATVSCELALPAPPPGQVLDIDAVNLVVTPSGQQPQTLAYDKDCTSGGWHYDNASAPTKVQLCGVACDNVKKDPGAKISVTFGCATKGGVQ